MLDRNIDETRQLTPPKGSMVTPPDLQIFLWRRLTFDLLAPKV